MAFSKLGNDLLPARVLYNDKILRLASGGRDGFQYLSLHGKKMSLPASEYLKQIHDQKFSDLNALTFHKRRLEKSYKDMKDSNEVLSINMEKIYNENIVFLNEKIKQIEKDSQL